MFLKFKTHDERPIDTNRSVAKTPAFYKSRLIIQPLCHFAKWIDTSSPLCIHVHNHCPIVSGTTYARLVRPIHITKLFSDKCMFVFEIQTSLCKISRRGEQHGCGVEQVTLILAVALCLIFFPLGMGPGPLGPPPLYVLLLFPMVAALIFIFLSQAPK
ncbi:hypothetical protein HYC85_017557 [Camellia sinensis]|uniref:Uncharacterized protein n=1 Tax=Camellia sinensis TaxID=4442 RepID=A0A7J7GS03_CAMSI|nr:hypothetical protein HYC85_017557 [Camellia sinensis]